MKLINGRGVADGVSMRQLVHVVIIEGEILSHEGNGGAGPTTSGGIIRHFGEFTSLGLSLRMLRSATSGENTETNPIEHGSLKIQK